MGALFLGFIAVVPLGIKAVTGIASLAIGGTALFDCRFCCLETAKQIEAQTSMMEYE